MEPTATNIKLVIITTIVKKLSSVMGPLLPLLVRRIKSPTSLFFSKIVFLWYPATDGLRPMEQHPEGHSLMALNSKGIGFSSSGDLFRVLRKIQPTALPINRLLSTINPFRQFRPTMAQQISHQRHGPKTSTKNSRNRRRSNSTQKATPSQTPSLSDKTNLD